MTPAERLKAIEERGFWTALEESYHVEVADNFDWLIARVKRLTEALQFYGMYEQEFYFNGKPIGKGKIYDGGEIARKALEEE